MFGRENAFDHGKNSRLTAYFFGKTLSKNQPFDFPLSWINKWSSKRNIYLANFVTKPRETKRRIQNFVNQFPKSTFDRQNMRATKAYRTHFSEKDSLRERTFDSSFSPNNSDPNSQCESIPINAWVWGMHLIVALVSRAQKKGVIVTAND